MCEKTPMLINFIGFCFPKGLMRDRDAYPNSWGVPEEIEFHGEEASQESHEQNPKVVQKWLHEDCLAITVRANGEGAEIHWVDETGIESDEYNAEGYTPKNTKQLIHLNARKNHISMISSISKDNHL